MSEDYLCVELFLYRYILSVNKRSEQDTKVYKMEFLVVFIYVYTEEEEAKFYW